MQNKPFILELTINQEFKSVPYRAEHRQDSPNYGFVNVKGNPDAAARIAEVQDDEALRDAIVRINAQDTAFFTIGCEKSFNQDGAEFWTRGFIDFAFNYCALVADAQNYFPVFFHFNNRLLREKFNHLVRFEWQLEENHFRDANCKGFSVILWITTRICASDEESRSLWRPSVKIVADHLAEWSLAAPAPPTIY
jgi:hypothetical protein